MSAKKKRSSTPRRSGKPSTPTSSTSPTTTRKRIAKLPRQEQVEVVPLGKQPLVKPVFGQLDKHGKPVKMYEAKVVDQFEYRAKGKAVHELVGMADKTIAEDQERVAKAEDQFGFDTIMGPDGTPRRLRLDEIEHLRHEPERGYGRQRSRPSIIVPDLPWKKDRVPRPGRTRIRTVNGQRVEEYKPA